MEFGSVQNLEGIDWRLPDEPLENLAVLGRKGGKKEGVVRIGCTGFSVPEWVGTVYPPGTRSRDFLRAYGRQFDTIEFNTTHYRIPSMELVKRWGGETGADFRFCPKVLQRVSHGRLLGIGTDLGIRFWEAVLGFEEKLGPCFLQLPERFGPASMDALLRFLDSVPGCVRLAVELRHPGWFDGCREFERLCEVLHKKGMGLVITDVAGRRDVLHMRLTAGFGMIRFVGNGMHSSDFSRIDEWARRIEKWFAGGLGELFFFAHQPDNLHAPELSIYLAQTLKRISGIDVRTPQMHSGRQGTLF